MISRGKKLLELALKHEANKGKINHFLLKNNLFI